MGHPPLADNSPIQSQCLGLVCGLLLLLLVLVKVEACGIVEVVGQIFSHHPQQPGHLGHICLKEDTSKYDSTSFPKHKATTDLVPLGKGFYAKTAYFLCHLSSFLLSDSDSFLFAHIRIFLNCQTEIGLIFF